jgi:hypothetical protein
MNPYFDRRWWRLAGSLAATLVLSACGGVDTGGTGSPVSATFSAGPITGFGSIIVNGVRYDDSSAELKTEDGATLMRSDLKLGMQTEVMASAVTNTAGVAGAVASQILVRNSVLGPVQSIDVAGSRLTVLGQSVSVVPTTVFDASLANGLASLSVGNVVEVFGLFDAAAQRYVATRIQPRPGAATYQLRGVVADLSLSGQTLRMGQLIVDWSSVAPANAATVLAVGRFVRVTLAIAPTTGVWRATALAGSQPMLADHDRAEIEGRITALASATSFALNGLPVDATNASFPDGVAGVVLGAKVEAEGSVRNGVLIASRVSLEDDEDGAEAFELHGTIESFNNSEMTFVVRGITVRWTTATRFDSSSPVDIKVGAKLELKGSLSADGTQIDASLIHIER